MRNAHAAPPFRPGIDGTAQAPHPPGMSRHNLTSGDMLADRRFAYAEAARAEGDLDAALDLTRQAMEIAPLWAAGWFRLGEIAAELGQRDEAEAALRKTLELAPEDPFGAGAHLARLTGGAASALPEAYVRELFDEYAPRFDAHLTGALGYSGPQAIREAILARGSRRFMLALDLGCGTGLSGAALRDLCDRLEGVDLSPRMVEAARRKALYDRLETGTLEEFLDSCPAGGADLVVAADVFVYLGDVRPVFARTARALAPGGLFAFTTQAYEGKGFRLLDDLRFGHAKDWLAAELAAAGFGAIAVAPVSTRRDRGADVPGFLATAIRA